MKLKIISVKDKAGNEKTEFMDELRKNHPSMSGRWIYPFLATQDFGSFHLLWDDQTDRCLVTSAVKNLIQADTKVVVTTRNSVYEFEIIGE